MKANEKYLSVTQRFEDIVQHHGDHIAVASTTRQYTYTELNERANQLAHYIQMQCGKKFQPVALLFSHTEYTIIAMLAVLKSGNYYIPIDASFPQPKIQAILEDCAASVLLISHELQDLAQELNTKLTSNLWICNIDLVDTTLPKTNPKQTITPKDPAYIIYTSGSTGKPKGVVHNQAYISWLTQTYTASGQMTCNDRFALLYSPAFAGAIRDIYCALLNGGTVLPFNIRQHDISTLRTWLIEQKISVVFFVTTLFRHFARSLHDTEYAPPLRLIEIGSEPVHFSDAELYQRHFPESCKLIINFGGSEISPITQYLIEKNSPITNPLPVGKPVKGVQVIIVDENKHPLPAGKQGEIVVCSDHLALGYWQKSELSAVNFTTTIEPNGKHGYYSGDIGMLLADGSLVHLGRKDFQVKVRGYRVETSEVEAAMISLDYIRTAVVSAATDNANNNNDNFLLAHIVPTDFNNSISLARLRADLATCLPDYMIPSLVIPISKVPLTDTGKTNRLALPKPRIPASPQAIYAEDANSDMERSLSHLWAQLLHISHISVKDNFFELGGHSLLALQMISRIRARYGCTLPLPVIFNYPVLEDLAHVIREDKNARSVVISALHKEDSAPLSFAQQRMWFLMQFEGENRAYNMCRAFQLSGELNVPALRLALTRLTERHLILRSSFPEVNGQATVHIGAPYDGLQVFNRSDFEKNNLGIHSTNKQAFNNILKELASHPFELHKSPLLRTVLVKNQSGETTLLLNIHHIISDDWSMGLLLQELSQLYKDFDQNVEPVLPLLPIQYSDYAAWQRKWLQGDIFEQQLTFWQSQLRNAPDLLDLPTDFPRPAIKSFQGTCHISHLSSSLVQRIESLSQRQGLTLFMTLLGAYTLLLSRYSRQKDICVGTPIFNRTHPQTEELIGLFVNSLVLRNKIDNQQNCSDFLQQVRQTCLEAYAHQDIPFESLVESMNPERSLSHSPLYQVMFSLRHATQESLELPGIQTQRINIMSPTAKFDLVLEAFAQENPTTKEPSLILNWEYSTDLFTSKTIERMAGHFEVLLHGLVDSIENNQNQPVCRLPLMTEAEIHHQINKPIEKYTENNETLIDRFQKKVQQWPDNTAVTFEAHHLSYRELNIQANQLAHYLIEQGVHPNTLVGICMEKSLEMIVGILGILKAGGAYVPIDPQQPQDRLHTILEDSCVSLLLVTTNNELFNNTTCTQVEIGDQKKFEEKFSVYLHTDPNKDLLSSHINSQNLAYIIYTSGSTGRPKGCQINHANVLRLFDSTQSLFQFNEKDVWTLFHSFAFDFSVWEIWGALLHGGNLVLVPYLVSRAPDVFHRLLVREHVTILNQTPSAFHQLSEADRMSKDKLSLRKIIFGGESLDSTALKPWFTKHGDRLPELINMYGITETTIHVTYHPLSLKDTKQARNVIGSALPDMQVYLLDEVQQCVPMGIAGEIYVAGPGLSRGYLNRPALNAEKFLELNVNGIKKQLYKSGDLARHRPDGTLEYLGRIDQQVQLRGFRIEPGEIEACINQHPAIRECLILAQGENQDQHLQAYLIPDPVTAAPVCKLLHLKREGTLDGAPLHELPNGMTVAHLNKSETEFVYEEIFSQRHYVKHGITLHKDACVFDVGANIGLFSLFIAQECPNATLYAFEPLPPIFEKLQINNHIHGINTTLFNCGLSNQEGSDVFTFYPHVSVISGRFADKKNEHDLVKTFMNRQLTNGNRDTVYSNEDYSNTLLDELLTARLESKQFNCQFRTLSEVIAEQRVERIDLLKIDVEKSELDVLSGINDNDWHKIRQLVVEVHDEEVPEKAIQDLTCHNYEDQNNIIQNRQTHKKQGRLAFITQLLNDKGYTVTVEQEDLLQDTSLYNIYAHRPNNNQNRKPEPHTTRQTRTWHSLESLRNALREYLRQSLPEHMVPSGIIILDAFPLTPNGKIDQQALAQIEHVQTIKPVAARTSTEKQLVRIWSDVLKPNNVRINGQKSSECIGIHDNFFDLGGHSLLMTQLILNINNTFRCTLTLKIFYECQSIATMAAFITSQEAPARSSISAQLFDDACLSAWNVNLQHQKKVAAGPLENILLTGANGFVGVHLLEALLSQTTATIYCLIRANSSQHALDRLRASFKHYDLIFPNTGNRIIALAGDLSADKLGLKPKSWSTLCNKLDAIYHNGAQVHHLYPYHVLRKANVQSVATIIELAEQGSTKSIHYISTLSVANKETGSNYVKENHLEKKRPPIQTSGYVQSKWVAELLLQEALQAGVPVTIYRLGQITGHSITGACKVTDDNFLSLVKGCIQMGYAPSTGRPVQLMPVDVASRLVSGLSHQTENVGKVFHINNHQGLSWKEYLSWYQGLGYKLNLLPIEQWLTKLERIDDSNVLMPLVLYYTDPYYRESIQRMKNTFYDNSNTQVAMVKFGEHIPRPDQLKTPYLDFMKDNNHLGKAFSK